MGCCGFKDESEFMVKNVNKISDNKDVSCIVLMGDSVIDNFYWLNDKKLDVEQQCRNTFGKNVKIYNLAVDESETRNVLWGIRPNFTYVNARNSYGMDDYPVGVGMEEKMDIRDDDFVDSYRDTYAVKKDNVVYPLLALQYYLRTELNNIDTSKYYKPTVVLSVGGNDARIHLGKLASIMGTSKNVIDAMKKDGFIQNYKEIIRILIDVLNVNVICVLPYQIDATHFIYDYKIKVNELLKIMNFGMNELGKVCEQYNIPIIDLSRTFDPMSVEDYGRTPIEPSNKSGQYIVDLIEYIMKTYSFTSNSTSMIYYGKKDNFWVQKNNNETRNAYLYWLKKRNKNVKRINEEINLGINLFGNNLNE